MDVVQQEQIETDFRPNIVEHARNRPCIDIGLVVGTGEGRLEIVHRAHSMRRLGRIFGRHRVAAIDVLDATAVAAHLTAHGQCTAFFVLDDILEDFLGITAVGMPIDHRTFAALAAPQLIHGHVGDFALDVPQCHVDTADGVVEHGAVAPVRVDHHHLPHVFAVARITADEQWLEVVFDGFDHQGSALGEGGTAITDQPILVCFDLDDDNPDAIGSRQKSFDACNFHVSLFLLCEGTSPTRLTPESIPAAGSVPFGGRFEEAAALDEVLFDHVEVDLEAQARGVWHFDVPVLDYRTSAASDGNEVAPERFFGEVVFQCDEVLGGCCTVDAGHRADGCAGHVQRHRNAPLGGIIADALGLDDAAAGGHVGVNDVDTTGVDERFKAIQCVDVFTRADGCVQLALELDPLIGVLPRHQVFEPGQVVRLECFAQSDTVVDADMTEVVCSNRHFVTDGLAHLGNVLDNHVEPLGGDAHMGKRVLQRVQVEHLVEVGPVARRQHACWVGQCTRHADQRLDTDVHFEHRKAPRDAFLELFAHRHAIGFVGGVAVHTHAVAVLPTSQRVCGDPVCLAG